MKEQKENIFSQFVPYDIALRMKKLGFDEECLMLWEKTEIFTLLVRPEEFRKVVSERYIQAPLYQQAFEWARKSYNLVGYIHPLALLENTNEWGYEITNFETCWDEDISFQSYEEARLNCLNYLLNLI